MLKKIRVMGLVVAGTLLLASTGMPSVLAASNAGAANYEKQSNKSAELGASGLTQQQMQQMQTQATGQPKLTPPPASFKPECPASLSCVFKPAGYKQNSSAADDYGNYNLASRPNDIKINQVVIHTTEGSLQSAISYFQDPTSYVSAHYIVGRDGSVTQMVRLEDIAYHANDWYVNTHSIGIEHEGFAEDVPMTDAQYKTSTTLTKWLIDKYGIKNDLAHIVGHDNVPTPADIYMADQHWDPGPYFDWARYMTLLGGNNGPVPTGRATSQYVTITPDFTSNKQATTNCSVQPCVPRAAQASSFLPLYSGPGTGSPLIKDPYLAKAIAGTNAQSDWGDKAPTGYSYIVAERRAGWTAIWFAGQKAWFQDTGQVTTAAAGLTITPKGDKPVAVYGRPIPEASAAGWSDIPAAFRVPQTPLTKYHIQPGQFYTAYETSSNEYDQGCKNTSCTYPGDGTIVVGKDTFIGFMYNHRFMFVKLDDVTVGYKE